jgi:hypothetical protein
MKVLISYRRLLLPIMHHPGLPRVAAYFQVLQSAPRIRRACQDLATSVASLGDLHDGDHPVGLGGNGILSHVRTTVGVQICRQIVTIYVYISILSFVKFLP